jgi:hypothetical protein
MEKIIKKVAKKIRAKLYPSKGKNNSVEENIQLYFKNGRIPWSQGYSEYKYKFITETINSEKQLAFFKNRKLPQNFGLGIDERCVEYPWLFSKLSLNDQALLDAGSTFNFDFIVSHPLIKNKKLTIYTFFPEKDCFYKNCVNYVFGDLRDMYFKDESFHTVISHSTIEHIDMDNSIYGYNERHTAEGEKSYDYLKAILEMIRVLKPGGKLMITFPFGKYEYHGFFQQFDREMLDKLLTLFTNKGTTGVDYFKYEKEGWRFAEQNELHVSESYNPHTGKGKYEDGAAHSRSIACIEFIKNM